MADPPTPREPLSGGSLRKLVGRAKEMAGSLVGHRDHGRGGRSRRIAVDERERAVDQAVVAERKAEEADPAAKEREAARAGRRPTRR